MYLAPTRGAVRGAGAALALLVAVMIAVAFWVNGRNAERRVGNPLAHVQAWAGVAAAYGHPLHCLSVTILATHPTYARADFNHANACGRYTGFPTAIFHYVSGDWQPVLVASSYLCPVASLPLAVQIGLGVCEQTIPAHRASSG